MKFDAWLTKLGLHRRVRRRLVVGALLALGAVLLWMPVDAASGVLLLLAGLLIEALGLRLERRLES